MIELLSESEPRVRYAHAAGRSAVGRQRVSAGRFAADAAESAAHAHAQRARRSARWASASQAPPDTRRAAPYAKDWRSDAAISAATAPVHGAIDDLRRRPR